MINRRTFLKGLGVTLVAVAGGGVYRAVSEGVFSVGQGPAYAPWVNWRTDSERGPLELVRAAILAANPHNSQPWLFRITTDRIDLFADERRNLGAVDPFRREMHLGLGCALENMVLAARAEGYSPIITLTPDAADPMLVARVDLTPAAPEADELYHAIPQRHTNRGAYDLTRHLAADLLTQLDALNTEADLKVFWFVGDDDRRRVAELIVAATEAFIADEEQVRDSDAWFRATWADLQRERSGLTLDAQALPPLVAAAAKMLPALPSAETNALWLQNTRDIHTRTAAAFGLLAARDSGDVAQRLNGGRLWQRMHLWLTVNGLAAHPLNQPSERADREVQLGLAPQFGQALYHLLGSEAWQALMPFRVGYPTVAANLSPRRAAEAVLLSFE
jgi:hypothetical protein